MQFIVIYRQPGGELGGSYPLKKA